MINSKIIFPIRDRKFEYPPDLSDFCHEIVATIIKIVVKINVLKSSQTSLEV